MKSKYGCLIIWRSILIKSKYLWNKQIDGIVKDQDIFKMINQNRDIHDHEAFFSMGVESLHSPFLFSQMQVAIDRINLAISKDENILIFGDYDCDGITSVAILYRALKDLDASVYYQVPNRFEDGYGLNLDLVKEWVGQYSLVITVDNGITSIDEVEYLQNHKVDVIVTDHHQLKEYLPKAYAILHTKVSDQYPFKEISGCMVAFKLAWALKGEFPQDLTDLAMIGTIADLMPLEDENQAMVNIGLEQLKHTRNLGLSKILSYSDLDIINQTAIAFQIAPKINSSGRMNQAETAIELLITNDLRQANELILKIEENHVVRKKHTETSFKIAESLINHEDQVLVLASEKFHEGVIGICAQRISEKYQKPTIVLTIEDDIAKGSARSFGQVSILKMLTQTEDLLDRFGGHHQAAGMQLKLSNIDEFRQKLNSLDIKESEPVLDIDMEVVLDQVSKDTIQELQEKSFHTALFLMRNLRVIRKQIIGQNHVKLLLESNHQSFDAVKFNQLSYFYSLNEGDVIDVVGGLTINRYRNKESIQVMISDLSCDHFQVLDYRRSLNISKVQDNILSDFTYLNDQVVLMTSHLKNLMHGSKSYALFPKQLKINFNYLLDRNQMANLYIKLKRLSDFSKFDIMKLVDQQEWVSDTLIKIFLELGFAIEKNGLYNIQESSKKDLSESQTYLDVLEKKKTIDWLYLTSQDKIKTYLEDKNGL